MNTQTLSLLERLKDGLDEYLVTLPEGLQLLADTDAAIAAERRKEQAKPQKEPILQVFYCDEFTADCWIDATKEQFDNTKDDYRRMVYTSPQPLKLLSDEHPLKVFARECALGCYAHDEIREKAKAALNARAIELKLGVGK